MSEYSEAASLEAISIAKRTESDLIVLSVATKNANLPAAKKSVEKVEKIAERENIKVKVLTPKGTPYEVIVTNKVISMKTLIIKSLLTSLYQREGMYPSLTKSVRLATERGKGRFFNNDALLMNSLVRLLSRKKQIL